VACRVVVARPGARLAVTGVARRCWAVTAYTRDEIVASIQLATAHDAGKTVGARRFQTLTGIAPAAWRGIYWARWGDALRAAGFEPNAWAQRRDEDELLTQAVGMVRRLGEMPSGLVAKLRGLAKTDPAYADIADRRSSGS
jgi:hypothetical protein